MPTKFPHVSFLVSKEYLDADGIWNPRDEDPPMECAFQINVFGTRQHYLRLAEAIRQFAERDTSFDGDHHEHFGGILNADGKVRLHIILRKDDVGDSIWKMYFPKDEASDDAKSDTAI
jgi:hypothetical protein